MCFAFVDNLAEKLAEIDMRIFEKLMNTLLKTFGKREIINNLSAVPGLRLFMILWLNQKFLLFSNKKITLRPNTIIQFISFLESEKRIKVLNSIVLRFSWMLKAEFVFLWDTASQIELGESELALQKLNKFEEQLSGLSSSLKLEKLSYKEFKRHVDKVTIAASLFYEMGLFDRVSKICELPSITLQDAQYLISKSEYLNLAFAHGQTQEISKSRHFFSRAFFGYTFNIENDFEKKLLGELCKEDTFLQKIIVPDLDKNKKDRKKIAFFFVNSPSALGHAILDPYHFLNLHRKNFDSLYLVGPDLNTYSNSCRAAISLLFPYCNYIEVQSEFNLNLGWMNLGTFEIGNYTFFIDNYWSILSKVQKAHQDQSMSFKYNNWFPTVSKKVEKKGAVHSSQIGIDMEKPIICLHAREHSYHKINKQNFRSTSIYNYVAGINFLLKKGYQVIRLGDQRMDSLEKVICSPSYFELPKTTNYEPELDYYYIAKSKFMIGCQSGPCSYARVLGVPLLSLNAVFSYTLFPSIVEMASYKEYYLFGENHQKVRLTETECIKRDIFLLETSHLLKLNNIEIKEMHEDDITMAISDMLRFIDKKEIEMSPLEKSFHLACRSKNQELSKNPPAKLKIASYLGITLPKYRLANSVLQNRLKNQKSQTTLL